jgi:hypothetical protein
MRRFLHMNIGKVISGIGVLIAVYLFVSRADETATIINTIASNSVAGIKTLQGRG